MPTAGKVLTHGLAVLVGAGCGVLGSFAHAATWHGLPVGLAVGLGLTGAFFVLAGQVAGTRTAVLAATAGWLVPVVLLASPRAEGDLVVTGGLLGSAWMFGGILVAVAVALGTSPSVRSRPVR
jgi:Family of unknown function (DUF6113)